MARFFDRQDLSNPANGSVLPSSVELRQLLARLSNRPPFFAELIGDNGYKLLLGIGTNQACVQHSAEDGSPPYLMAVAHDATDSAGRVEFLIGDTPSPVPMRYCIPYQTMLDIAARFVDAGIRDTRVAWEEI